MSKKLKFETYIKLSDVSKFNRIFNGGVLDGNFGYKSNTDLVYMINRIMPKIESYTQLTYPERQQYSRFISVVDFCRLVNFERVEDSICIYLPLDLFELINYAKTDEKIELYYSHQMADINFKNFLIKLP